MKRLIALALALSLAGCASLGLPGPETLSTGIKLATTSVANPVTEERLEQLESGFIAVVSTLKAWKSSCQKGLIPRSCRAQIATVQTYTRQIPPYLEQLRAFVRNNDQVNAWVLFEQVQNLIATARTQSGGKIT